MMSYLMQHVVLFNLSCSLVLFLLGLELGLPANRLFLSKEKNAGLLFLLFGTLSWVSFGAAYVGIVLAFKGVLFWEGFFSPLVDLNIYIFYGVLSFGLLVLWRRWKES